MAKREFVEFTGVGQDADGEDVESTIKAHVVTKETAGEYVGRDGNAQVREGQVLIETDRPGIYDVLSAEQWAGTGYPDKNPSANRSSVNANKNDK